MADPEARANLGGGVLMSASDLLLLLRTSGATVTLNSEGRVQIEAPAGLLDEALRCAIRDQRDHLADLLRNTHAGEERGHRPASLASLASGLDAPGQVDRTQKSQITRRRTPVLAADVSSAASPLLPLREGTVLSSWHDGVHRLMTTPPLLGFTYRRWECGVFWAQRLVESAAPLAADLGWRAEALFGLHPTAPSARYDAMGLAFLLRPGDCIVSLTSTEAVVRGRMGAEQRFTPGRMSQESVPAWRLPSMLPVNRPAEQDAGRALITRAA